MPRSYVCGFLYAFSVKCWSFFSDDPRSTLKMGGGQPTEKVKPIAFSLAENSICFPRGGMCIPPTCMIALWIKNARREDAENHSTRQPRCTCNPQPINQPPKWSRRGFSFFLLITASNLLMNQTNIDVFSIHHVWAMVRADKSDQFKISGLMNVLLELLRVPFDHRGFFFHASVKSTPHWRRQHLLLLLLLLLRLVKFLRRNLCGWPASMRPTRSIYENDEE